MDERGDQRQVEHELGARLKHVNALEIRPLSAEEIKRFTAEWRATHVEFVDEPLTAMQSADQLIRKVMQARGYPVEDFEQQAADISVDYPDLVMDYRGLHLIAVKGLKENVSTEEMRQAMLHGRTLFHILMQNNENNIVKAHEKVKGKEQNV
jgi:bacterioferritin (cytochrome b1)